jgi:hypothetical protein
MLLYSLFEIHSVSPSRVTGTAMRRFGIVGDQRYRNTWPCYRIENSVARTIFENCNRQRRGPANRLGFAVQLCYLRFPGVILGVEEPPFPPLLKLVADQLKVGVESWDEYGQREQTRREGAVRQTVKGLQIWPLGQDGAARETDFLQAPSVPG